MPDAKELVSAFLKNVQNHNDRSVVALSINSEEVKQLCEQRRQDIANSLKHVLDQLKLPAYGQQKQRSQDALVVLARRLGASLGAFPNFDVKDRDRCLSWGHSILDQMARPRK